MNKTILDLAGGTGAWSDKYKEEGYTVYNITLPYYDILESHISTTGRILFNSRLQTRRHLVIKVKDIYGILFAPVCTDFSLARTRAKTPRDFRKAMKLVRRGLEIIWECRYYNKSNLKFWCIENPRGYLRQFLGKPVMTFTRCQFGDEGGKPTDLWGYFNKPKLLYPNAKPERGNQNTESKWYNSVKKPSERAITPPGFANAFFRANQ